MTTYQGRVIAPPRPGSPEGALGPFVLSVPEEPGGHITGNLKIGAMPHMAMTGFSGPYTGEASFEAKGENTRGIGIDQMHLAVVLRGTIGPDRKTVAGIIYSVLNGVDQPEWTFVSAAEGEELPSVIGEGAIGAFDTGLQLETVEKPGMLTAAWRKIPPGLKLAVGTGLAAIGGGIYWYRRQKG